MSENAPLRYGEVREVVTGEKEEPGASLSITILREFSLSRKAENDPFVWVHAGVQVYITHIYVRVCVYTMDGQNKHSIKRDINI